MDDSIEGTVKEGNRSIMLGSIQSGESSVSSMGSDRLKVRMTVGFGTSAVLALRPTAPTYGEGREQFETYHHPLELAVVRELPASRYVSVVEGFPHSMSE